MFQALSQNLDYLLFATASVVLLAGVHRALPSVRLRIPACLVLVVVGAGWWFVQNAEHLTRHRLGSLVRHHAPTYARELELLGHGELPLDASPEDQRYLEMIRAQVRWLSSNPSIADIYTFRRLADGRIVLLVDSETDYDGNGRYDTEREQRTPIGEVYPEASSAVLAAFTGRASFDDEPFTYRWGTWVSAY